MEPQLPDATRQFVDFRMGLGGRWPFETDRLRLKAVHEWPESAGLTPTGENIMADVSNLPSVDPSIQTEIDNMDNSFQSAIAAQMKITSAKTIDDSQLDASKQRPSG
jgi:hypothetical protein